MVVTMKPSKQPKAPQVSDTQPTNELANKAPHWGWHHQPELVALTGHTAASVVLRQYPSRLEGLLSSANTWLDPALQHQGIAHPSLHMQTGALQHRTAMARSNAVCYHHWPATPQSKLPQFKLHRRQCLTVHLAKLQTCRRNSTFS